MEFDDTEENVGSDYGAVRIGYPQVLFLVRTRLYLSEVTIEYIGLIQTL
jgi:hypothetical protein